MAPRSLELGISIQPGVQEAVRFPKMPSSLYLPHLVLEAEEKLPREPTAFIWL